MNARDKTNSDLNSAPIYDDAYFDELAQQSGFTAKQLKRMVENRDSYLNRNREVEENPKDKLEKNSTSENNNNHSAEQSGNSTNQILKALSHSPKSVELQIDAAINSDDQKDKKDEKDEKDKTEQWKWGVDLDPSPSVAEARKNEPATNAIRNFPVADFSTPRYRR